MKNESSKTIKQLVKVVVSQLKASCKRNDSWDNPEFVAYEIIDLIEWLCFPQYYIKVASRTLNRLDFAPETAKGIVRKYFDIYY